MSAAEPADGVRMVVNVRGYLTFRDLVGKRQVELEQGATLRKLLEALAQELGEGFARQVLDGKGGLQRAVGVLVNGVHRAHSPDGLETVLRAGDEIAIFPPMAGG